MDDPNHSQAGKNIVLKKKTAFPGVIKRPSSANAVPIKGAPPPPPPPRPSREDGEIELKPMYNKDKSTSRSSSPDRPHRSDHRHHSSERGRYRSSQSRSQSRSPSRSRYRSDDDRDRSGYRHSSRDADRSYHHHHYGSRDNSRDRGGGGGGGYDRHRDSSSSYHRRDQSSSYYSHDRHRDDDDRSRGYYRRRDGDDYDRDRGYYRRRDGDDYDRDRGYSRGRDDEYDRDRDSYYRRRRDDDDYYDKSRGYYRRRDGDDGGGDKTNDKDKHTQRDHKSHHDSNQKPTQPRPMVRVAPPQTRGEEEESEDSEESVPTSPNVDKYIECIALALGLADEYSPETGFTRPDNVISGLGIVEQQFRGNQAHIWDEQEEERRLLLIKLGLLSGDDVEPFSGEEFSQLPPECVPQINSNVPPEDVVPQTLPFDPVEGLSLGDPSRDPRRKYTDEYKAMAAWAARPLPLSDITITEDGVGMEPSDSHEMHAMIGSPLMKSQQQESPQQSGSWATSPPRKAYDEQQDQEQQQQHDDEQTASRLALDRQQQQLRRDLQSADGLSALDAPAAPSHHDAPISTGKLHTSLSNQTMTSRDQHTIPSQQQQQQQQVMEIDEGFFEVQLHGGAPKIQGQYASLVEMMKEGKIPHNYPAYRPSDGLCVPVQEGLTMDALVWPLPLPYNNHGTNNTNTNNAGGDGINTTNTTNTNTTMKSSDGDGSGVGVKKEVDIEMRPATALSPRKAVDDRQSWLRKHHHVVLMTKEITNNTNNTNVGTVKQKTCTIKKEKKRTMNDSTITTTTTTTDSVQHKDKKQRVVDGQQQHGDDQVVSVWLNQTTNTLLACDKLYPTGVEIESKNKPAPWGYPVPPHLVAAVQGYILSKHTILNTLAIGALQKAVREHALKEKGTATGGSGGVRIGSAGSGGRIGSAGVVRPQQQLNVVRDGASGGNNRIIKK